MGEQDNVRSMQVYDVALWFVWPSLFPDVVGHMQAYGTYSAVLMLLEAEKVEKVAYASARLVGHSRIDRWSKLYMPLTSERRVRG